MKYLSIIMLKKRRKKTKQCLISAHPGIDLGPLVSKIDMLTTRLKVRSCAARNNRTHWTDNPSIGHIRFRKQGKKGK